MVIYMYLITSMLHTNTHDTHTQYTRYMHTYTTHTACMHTYTLTHTHTGAGGSVQSPGLGGFIHDKTDPCIFTLIIKDFSLKVQVETMYHECE